MYLNVWSSERAELLAPKRVMELVYGIKMMIVTVGHE